MMWIVLSFMTQAVFADPLFDRMKGDWQAEGERAQIASGRRTQIQIHIQSLDRGTQLDSRNQIVELGEDGRREYARNYWIRPAAGMGAYELGRGQNILSHGSLVGDVFTVIQSVGTWTFRTDTTFAGADESDSLETFSDEGGAVSRTHLHYRRLPKNLR